MKNNVFEKIDIKVIDAFIDKFAKRYLELRSNLAVNLSGIQEHSRFKNCGFDTAYLETIIAKNSVAHDAKRENGQKPRVLNDIYRSDLGELLMTYYFEEKLDKDKRFVIPLKNITYRERFDQPGRGVDTIGYRILDDSIEILFGEAKVSEQQKNPPDVVHATSDSIYHTQKQYCNDKNAVIQRLTDYCRRLNSEDAAIIGVAILHLDSANENCELTLGCSLIRDFSCVDDSKDYGKLKKNIAEFNPHKVHFSILSFSDKKIEEAVQLFYKKVQELLNNE